MKTSILKALAVTAVVLAVVFGCDTGQVADNAPVTGDDGFATVDSEFSDAPMSPGGAGVGVTAVDSSTHVNSLLVVDLDGDGKDDIIGTLDRRSGSGLSDDRLVWYRNTKDNEP